MGVELAKALLQGDEDQAGVLSGVEQAAVAMERVAPYLPEAEEAAQKLREAQYLLEDADSLLHSAAIDFDPAALDQIEERLDLLYKLGRKYGDSEEKILQYLADCQEKLHAIEFSDEERERLTALYEAEKQRAIALAKQLSEQRKRASLAFAKAVKAELAFLNMPGMEFLVDIQRVPLTAMAATSSNSWLRQQRGTRQTHGEDRLRRRAVPHHAGHQKRCSPARTKWTP